ncbi:hypothetical protein Trydic_g11091 [Trypoxylus dichotomus]
MGNLHCCPEVVTHRPRQIEHQHVRGRVSIVSIPSTAFAGNLRQVVTCLYDYNEARSGKKFRKGDPLQVYNEIDDEWLKVLNLSTNDIACIPKTYVTEESTNEIQDWFVGQTTRREAERLFMRQDTLVRGLFLVRYSGNEQNSYTLSVLDHDDKDDFHVVHFQITVNQGGFLIDSESYPTLSEIVSVYKKNGKISKPCPKPPPHLWDLDVAHKKEWELSRNDLELRKVIGEGNFAKVHLAYWKNSTKVAVKILKEQSITKDELLREATIMKQFRHPGLLTLYGVCSKAEPVYLVLEYMKNGDLLKFLRKDAGNELKILDLIDMAAQISSGMQHLESKNLVHRDLAARNVLVGNNNIVKISDFGLARLLQDNKYNDNFTSNIAVKWSAPEAILLREFTPKSDVWSFGIFLMELFTFGKTPYQGIRNEDVIKLVNSGYRLEKPSDFVPDSVYDIMQQCWKENTEERISFKKLTNFFNNFLE